MPMLKKKPKALGLRRALDLMRRHGTRMIAQNINGEFVHYVVPGGYVEPDTAQKIKEHPMVFGGYDGLFPGMHQTWRMGGV